MTQKGRFVRIDLEQPAASQRRHIETHVSPLRARLSGDWTGRLAGFEKVRPHVRSRVIMIEREDERIQPGSEYR